MRTRALPTVIALVLAAACTGGENAAPIDALPDAALEPMAGIPPSTPESTAPAASTAPVALLGEHGHLGPVRDGAIDNTWLKWTARPSPDGTTAVMTLQPEQGRTISDTYLAWASVPSGEQTAAVHIQSAALEATAVSQDGEFVALTNFADEPVGDQIAGAKPTTTLVIASREGARYKTGLDGNFVAEAFGRRTGANGLPAQVFLLEYFPAADPTFYRVRVLSTETGEVSLPLNLRNKAEQVDERMAGFSRSQVIANEQGLLFTLYRGTIDGTPDGDPYAFVHTLDLADGVWCLDVDPSLELDRVAGALAVGGDRLYVASANGRVGSFPIPSITDPDLSPTMDWVVDVARPGDEPPVLLADDDGVWVGTPDDVSRLIRLAPDGDQLPPVGLPSGHPLALAHGKNGVVAIGDGWSTFGEVALPDWFGEPVALLPG